MFKEDSFDVLIVGGGPAGLSVAEALAPELRVLIVHQDREIGLPVRTSGCSWVRDLEDLGIPAHLYHVLNRMEFYADTAQSGHDLTTHKAAVLDVTGLYRWLAARSEHENRTLLCGTKFLSAKRVSGGIRAVIRERGRGEREVFARKIVDASGWHGAVMAALGDVPKPERIGVGIEYETPIGSARPDRGIIFLGSAVPSGYGWAFPDSHGHIRIGAGVIHPDSSANPKDLMARFLASDMPARMGLEIGEVLRVNAGTLPSVPYAPKLVFGDAVRTGDAANFATPTVGEGLRIVIDYGRLLGAALSATLLKGDARALTRYEATCAKALRHNYRIGFQANQRLARYGPAEFDGTVRRIAALSESEAVALIRSEFPSGMAAGLASRWLGRRLSGLGAAFRKPLPARPK
ncbi:NAD(P)/FAD-dependent oxidoreductase [Pseudoruegeria sp. SHC-113]|uniref:NAD(P)/FAD-dependent oxidoreductase n=1 Tax=Pseudoruegeria sp. SHC-113 TaxID=2855439 RepID=UPI0021BB72CC|nr:NAD(P)/FAD-dependent oxidoreductase [Pseudoruegeria sp. SHC-113]MCT8158861.1 NAD(P)/FAD-dependent oxidoreductase [Pseudoruegeria sp. SHC-113]